MAGEGADLFVCHPILSKPYRCLVLSMFQFSCKLETETVHSVASASLVTAAVLGLQLHPFPFSHFKFKPFKFISIGELSV